MANKQVANKRFSPQLSPSGLPPEKIVQRLVEGLDATKTIVARYKGKITDQIAVTAWATRLNYAELASKMAGYYVE